MNGRRLSLLFLPVLLGSCALFSVNRTITIEIPPVTGDLEESCRGPWALVMSSPSGRQSEETVEWPYPPPESIEVKWPKGEDLLVQLTPPEWSPGIGPFPCGAFIPPDSHSGLLSWRDGAAISVLTEIIRAGGDLQGLNCSRFLSEMGALENPWTADRELLVRQLGRREMRSWYIRDAALFTVSLTLPEGEWYFQYCLLEPLVSTGEPGELNLPEGYASLYNPETRLTAEVQVDDHGEAVWMLASPGSFQSMAGWPVCSR